jgi:RNA polymerase sigma-70 factor (ECF subfamily)
VVEVVVVTKRDVDVGALVLGRLPEAYRLARAILLDDADAEDAVQQASFTAWQRQRSLRDPDRFEPWFERILVNQCRDQLRKRRRSVPIVTPPPAFEPGAATTDPADEDPDLDAALATLDVDHRVVVVMRYWQDRTIDDIAARLGIPSGTVKSRLHHSLRTLRSRLEASHGRP